MAFLKGKRLLITGALSSSSLAYGIAQSCFREGAELAFTYQDERLAKRVKRIAEQFNSELCFPCDVANDEQITGLFDTLGKHWDTFDGLVHAIAFVPPGAISGDFLDGLSRDAFRIAHDISAFSFPALAKGALPMMQGKSGSMLTLTYQGSQRVNSTYNTMGMAKASLESGVRYLAGSLGSKDIRVNGVSAGPIRTVASAGIPEFDSILAGAKADAPLGRNVTIEEVGDVSAFLLSDMATGVTGEIIYVDAGVHIR